MYYLTLFRQIDTGRIHSPFNLYVIYMLSYTVHEKNNCNRENGANLKVLMKALQCRDRKGFVSTYITPNIEADYIAMLPPETPNHPM